MHVDTLPSKSIELTKSENFNDVIDDNLTIRNEYRPFFETLLDPKIKRLREKAMATDLMAYLEGFTYNVKPDEYNVVPIDYIPRIITENAFQIINDGLKQRAKTLNMFLTDVYSGKKTIVPEELVFGSEYFDPSLVDHLPKNNIFIQVYGADLLYDGKNYFVIEDNLRVPSGVTYPIKIREICERYLPELRRKTKVHSYKPWKLLLKAMKDAAWTKNPFMVLLSDGVEQHILNMSILLNSLVYQLLKLEILK